MRAKRALQCLRAIPMLILVCLLNLPAQAKYGGGSGTAQDPYQIATAADLILLSDSPGDYGKHFILTADIDLDPRLPGRRTFYGAPITSSRGVFDGGGHTISHLTVKSGEYVGLFGRLASPGEVKNLGVVDVSITGSGRYVGALVGCNGYVNATGGSLTDCYSTGAVSGNSSVGGLVGSNDWEGTVTRCYSTGKVSGTGQYVGGLVGSNWWGVVAQCYSTGVVSGQSYVGGLVGVGSLASNSFWDIQTSGLTTSAAGKGRTTEQMKRASNYAGWNACGHTAWTIDEGMDYPHLAWEGKAGAAIPSMSLADSLSGKGIPTDPYLIESPEQFYLIGLYPCDWDKCFRLMADIDLSGYRAGEYSIIGFSSNQAFRGVFDGNGHKLLNYRGSDALFGCVVGRNAEVKNLGLIKPDVVGDDARSLLVGELSDGTVSNCDVQDCNLSNWAVRGTYTGGLVYRNSGTITNCHVSGQVYGDRHWVGGLVASNGGTITYCSFSGSLTHGSSGGVLGTGGLVGDNSGGISFCYSTGLVSGDLAGGLVGTNSRVISNCYSMSNVSGFKGTGAGLVYENSGIISNCYSSGGVTFTCPGSFPQFCHVGGLVGRSNGGVVTGGFWDTQNSGLATSDGATGKTTAEMHTAKAFLDAGWDFMGETANGTEEIWWIDEGKDYPRFSWEHGPYCPSQGAVDVVQPVVLNWGPGGRGLSHDVYFGEDEADVANAAADTPGVYRGRQPAQELTYNAGTLEWAKTYYWRIDEVNEADPNSLCKGDVWSFTTEDFVVLVVDDFEDYTDDWDDGHLIYETWVGNDSRGLVGNAEPPFAEQAIVRGGRQSMPMDYDNHRWYYYSEAERSWETPQDWTIDGADALTLAVRGPAGNGQDQLYARIEDRAGRFAVVAHPDPNAVLATQWQRWQIPLVALRAAGVDVAVVTKIAVGVGDRSSSKPGGSGKIYIDDIRLTESEGAL